MKLRFQFGGAEHAVEAAWSDGAVRVTLGERTIDVVLHRLDEHAFLLRDGSRRISCAVAGAGQQRQLWIDGRTMAYEVVDTRRAAATGGDEADLVASMPGVVLQVMVAVGDRVSAGDKLIVLESMKMEIVVSAPHAGIVDAIFCAEGQNVDGGQHLIVLKEEDA